MRVFLSSRRRPGSDDGAVAIMMAILMVVLVGLAAFATDFGMAYTSKRQLQTAADAAALAAAATYVDRPGTCGDMADSLAHPDYLAAATAAAADIGDQNRPANTAAPLIVVCDHGELSVTTSLSGSTQTTFGSIFGANQIITERSATASVSVPSAVVSGVRPYAICSNDLPSGSLPSDVVKVSFPGTGGADSPCPTVDNPGNWWTINCPEDASNSNADLADKTRNGCDWPVSRVPNQPTPDPSPPNTALHDYLIDVGCSGPPDEDCLNAVTGNISGDPIWGAWEYLTSEGIEIILPVFCGDLVCDPGAVTGGGGNNADYPVHKLVSATVCGYHWGAGSQKHGQSNDGLCATNPWDASTGGNSESYILLVFHQTMVSGTTAPSECDIGETWCDGGLRRVLLTR